jgi:TatA/E family protein of Tat protein translocase
MSILGVSPLVATFLGGWEILLILAVVLILFGAKCLPEHGRGLGRCGWSRTTQPRSDKVPLFEQDADKLQPVAGTLRLACPVEIS